MELWVESGPNGPKLARQSIIRTVGPHPRPRMQSPPAVTPLGAHQTPKRMENTTQIDRSPLARFHAVKVGL